MRRLTLILLLGLAGCEKAMHDMYQQPKYMPYGAAQLFPDGKTMRPAVPGTVPAAEGVLAGTSSGHQGQDEAARQQAALAAQRLPDHLSAEMIEHGRQRFTIYCAPCHSPLGDGDGYIVRRGFPAPPSYHIARLRQAPDRHFFDVITQGYGIMYSYADRVTPADRWAIVAYIRALQLSQHAAAATLPAPLQAKLGAQR
jgi:mono/diheme cytochrome c family protein